MATAITGASAPIKNSQNLIVGYKGQKSKQQAQIPMYDSSGLITNYSPSGNPADTVTPFVNPNDPNGAYAFDPTTGLNKLGKTRGQQAVADYQNSTGLVTTVKSQPIAAAATDTLKNENALQTGVVKSFSDYLDEAKKLQETGAQQVAKDTATLDAAPKQLESQLSKTVQDFANTAGNLDTKVTDLNAANAKTVSGNIATLDQLNNTYDAQARQVADNSVAAAQARNNAAQSGTGTPASAGGYWNELAAKTYAQTVLPVEAQISQNRISQLTNYITPQQRQLYADQISQVTGLEMPIAQTLVQYGVTNANQVSQLKANLTGRSLSEQIQYLSSLGMPISVAQSVAQSLPQAIGQLANIDQNNTYYGLAQDYQAPLPNGLPTYNPGPPNLPVRNNNGGGYPYANSPYPNTGNVQSGQQPMGLPPGPAVGINGSGQAVDAKGNIVGYAWQYPNLKPFSPGAAAAPLDYGQPGTYDAPAYNDTTTYDSSYDGYGGSYGGGGY